jgi:hypothetical protein
MLAEQQAQLAECMAALEARGGEVAGLESRAAAIQRATNAALYEKQKGIEAVAALTRLLQRFTALEAGKLPGLTHAEADKVGRGLAEAEGARRGVSELVGTLAAQHADLAEVLNRVAQLVDIAPGLE